MNGGAVIAGVNRKQLTAPQPAIAQARARARPYRLRAPSDLEGFVTIIGRHGQLEAPDGRNLVVRANRPRLCETLSARGGVRRHQMGDPKMRPVIPTETLERIARVASARRTRTLAREAGCRREFRPVRREPSGRSER